MKLNKVYDEQKIQINNSITERAKLLPNYSHEFNKRKGKCTCAS